MGGGKGGGSCEEVVEATGGGRVRVEGGGGASDEGGAVEPVDRGPGAEEKVEVLISDPLGVAPDDEEDLKKASYT